MKFSLKKKRLSWSFKKATAFIPNTFWFVGKKIFFLIFVLVLLFLVIKGPLSIAIALKDVFVLFYKRSQLMITKTLSSLPKASSTQFQTMSGKTKNISSPNFYKAQNSKNKISQIVIRFYQKAISPYLAPRCRFTPTCSTYALECFQKFGWLKAFWLSLKRLLKCHPFCKGGHDPVP